MHDPVGSRGGVVGPPLRTRPGTAFRRVQRAAASAAPARMAGGLPAAHSAHTWRRDDAAEASRGFEARATAPRDSPVAARAPPPAVYPAGQAHAARAAATRTAALAPLRTAADAPSFDRAQYRGDHPHVHGGGALEIGSSPRSGAPPPAVSSCGCGKPEAPPANRRRCAPTEQPTPPASWA